MNKSLLDVSQIPSYGFQFALFNLGKLRNSFIIITIISILGGLLAFYGTFLLADLISKLNYIDTETISTFYIPAFLLAYIGKEGLEYFTRRDGEAFSIIAGNELNRKFFESILNSEASILSNLNKEDLFVSSSRYISRATGFLTDWVWNTSRKISQFILILIILASQSIYVCIGSILYLIIFLGFALSLSKKYSPYAQEVAEKGQTASSQLTQSYLAATIIRRLRLEEFFLGKLADCLKAQSTSVIKAQKFHAKRWLLQLNAFNFLYIGALFIGIYQVKAGTLQLGYLLLIRYAFERLWEIIVFIIEKFVGLIQEKEEAKVLRKLLEPILNRSIFAVQKNTISSFNTITIHQLIISLKNSKQLELFSLNVPNLKIESRDRISIKAPSGSGKTTFLLSLMKLIPFDGSINIDGIELDNLTLSPQFVSYVSPSEPLFPLSLSDNITLGRECSNSDIEKIINGLGINNFVHDRSVVIGNATVNLSLGQAQRIRLARALITKSPLLLLDEPFAGLDPESRETIKDFIISWCKESTIIIASHDSDDRLIASRHLTIDNGTLK